MYTLKQVQVQNIDFDGVLWWLLGFVCMLIVYLDILKSMILTNEGLLSDIGLNEYQLTAASVQYH